jgi:hypothetical protein
MKKDTEALLEASREVGLEVNTEKAKYILWVWRSRNDFINLLEGSHATL